MSHHNSNTREDIRCLDNKLNCLINLGEQIMSVISDFAAKQNAFNDQMDVSIAGLNDDIKSLNDKITQLQNSQGAITPEDQALLDAIEARGQTMSDKLAALDALTPPVVPAG